MVVGEGLIVGSERQREGNALVADRDRRAGVHVEQLAALEVLPTGGEDARRELGDRDIGGADADIPTTTLTEADLQDGSIDILGLLVKSGLSASRSEARRSVEQGGVSVNGEKVTDVKTQYAGEDLQGEGITLKRGKKSFKKIVMA